MEIVCQAPGHHRVSVTALAPVLFPTILVLLTLAVALAAVPPDLLRRDQRETNWEVWQPTVADRLKSRSLLWRELTMQLLRSAHNEKSRYTAGYVVGLLKEKLGRWLSLTIQLTGAKLQKRQSILTGMYVQRKCVADMADMAGYLPRYMHCSGSKWVFNFTDEETGKAHGFLYKESQCVVSHRVSFDPEFHEGYPVDFIVRPMVISRGDFTVPVSEWFGGVCVSTMQVAIDMFPDDVEAEHSGEEEDGVES